MNTSDIEYMWKVATNDPNHDTNWYDPVVVAFAKLVANHTMANIDPSSFMSYQEGYEAGKTAKPWVGLSEVKWPGLYTGEFRAGAEWAEQALKEKNT